jgi:hypothetical protein
MGMTALKGRLDPGLTGKERTLSGNDPFITHLTPMRGIALLPHVGISLNGVYSLHLPYWGAVLCCIFFLAVMIGISALSYRFIELPFRKLINTNIRGMNRMPYNCIIPVSDPDNIK